MKLFGLSILQIIIISQNELGLRAVDIPECYWREFTGHIPEDAIKAGKDANENPIFIGQTFCKDRGIYPTTIFIDSPSVTVPYRGQVLTINQHIMILCSRQPENYHWVATPISKMNLLVNYTLLPGGFESGLVLYIGRAFHEIEMQIGHVYPDCSPNSGLILSYDKKATTFKNFEVFAWKCSTN